MILVALCDGRFCKIKKLPIQKNIMALSLSSSMLCKKPKESFLIKNDMFKHKTWTRPINNLIYIIYPFSLLNYETTKQKYI